jgi:sec-independent protein translocase protein TatA
MNLLVLLFGLGPMEIVLIVAVVLLLFGGRKIPELMKGLGQGMREFKKASHVDDDQDQEVKKNDNK